MRTRTCSHKSSTVSKSLACIARNKNRHPSKKPRTHLPCPPPSSSLKPYSIIWENDSQEFSSTHIRMYILIYIYRYIYLYVSLSLSLSHTHTHTRMRGPTHFALANSSFGLGFNRRSRELPACCTRVIATRNPHKTRESRLADCDLKFADFVVFCVLFPPPKKT